MEQNELLAEQDRIRADEKLQLAYETAQKEAEIQKKLFNDNFNLIKNGKAGEIKLEKMSGKEKSKLAVKVGREALDQLAQNNKQAFALNKAFKLADAIQSTAQGVASALGTMNIPLAIAIGALGAVASNTPVLSVPANLAPDTYLFNYVILNTIDASAPPVIAIYTVTI